MPALNDIWNNGTITHKKFPNNLKPADVTSVLKKEDASLLKNYRLISGLPVVSKTIKESCRSRFWAYRQAFISSLNGYRKTVLISMLEKWKSSIDNKSFAGAVLMDLSKAFDTINQPLLLANRV